LYLRPSLLLRSAVVVGTWALNVVIMIHFTGWFVFAVEGIRKQTKEVERSITWRTPNQWIRRNQLGFWCFHGGLAAMFFLLIAMNHWYFAQQPLAIGGQTFSNPLTTLFCREHFYSWTLSHVTLGFLSKPAAGKR
jgi:hypothetical protein